MARERRDPHDQPMGRHEDLKLRTIAESVVGRRCRASDVRDLGRAGDLIECPAGATFHAESDLDRWAYLLLDGDVAVSHHGDPIALATRGAWFPRPPRERPADERTSLTALSDSRLLVFRWPEVGGLLELHALAT
jgi:hypothetical protein